MTRTGHFSGQFRLLASLEVSAYHFRMDSPSPYAIWTTAAGPMGAVKSPDGLVRIVLPHYSAADLKDLLAFEYPGSAENPDEFADIADLSWAYFNGQAVGFDDVACDLPSAKTFAGRVLRACRGISYGWTRSYSWLAGAIGKPGSARAVAAALGRNPLPLVVPCHRVIHAGGAIGGFSAPGGVELKRRMLAIEENQQPTKTLPRAVGPDVLPIYPCPSDPWADSN